MEMVLERRVENDSNYKPSFRVFRVRGCLGIIMEKETQSLINNYQTTFGGGMDKPPPTPIGVIITDNTGLYNTAMDDVNNKVLALEVKRDIDGIL